MTRTCTLFAVAALALLALPACSDRSDPVSPDVPNASEVSVEKLEGVGLSAPVYGTAPAGGTISGSYSITGFVVESGQLLVIGTLSFTVYDASGAELGTFGPYSQKLPVLSASASCQSVLVEIGSLLIAVAGLDVRVDRQVLAVTPESGPGSPLGSPLCAIANLLDGGLGGLDLDGLEKLAKRLNQLLPLV